MYIYIYIYIYIAALVSKTFCKGCSVEEHYSNSKVFKQKKTNVFGWNLKFRADTAAIFSQMKKTLKFMIPWYLLHNITPR